MTALCLAILLGLPRPARAVTREIDKAQDLREPRSKALIASSSSSDPELRSAALRAMGRIQSPDYLKKLTTALEDPDLSVRREAAFSLGQMFTEEGPAKDASASDALAARLEEEEGLMRPVLYEALGKAGGPAAEKALADGLQDDNPKARAAAALGLFRLRFLKRVPEYSTAAVEGLLAAAQDPKAAVRWAAVYAFSRFAEPRAAGMLEKAAADDDLWTRFFALRGLAQLKAAPPTAALKDKEALVRAEAVKAVGAAGRADLLGAELLHDPSVHVRAAAADALGASAKPALAGELADLAKESSVLARGQALQAYAKLVPARALAYLDKERTFPHWWVKTKAYEAMGGLPGAEDILRQGCADPDPRVASAALEALAKSTAPFVEGLLADVLRDPKSTMELRGTAIDAAGERKSAALLEPLLAALQNSMGREDEELREDIQKALEAIAKEHPDAAKGRLFEALPSQIVASPYLGKRPAPASVVLQTERGEVEIALAVDEAPLHAAHFLASVKSGVYDETIWHRVASGFVVQGGDPRGSGWGDCGFSLRDEINPLHFERGTVGMPKAGKDTGGCQLFITHVPTPHLDGRYTVFGKVTRGMDVVDRLEPGDKILKARLK